jgi:hypothetical protein
MHIHTENMIIPTVHIEHNLCVPLGGFELWSFVPDGYCATHCGDSFPTYVHLKRGRGGGVSVTRGRCYDHNFLRFSPIFGEIIGVFLKYQCYDQFFAKTRFVLRQKCHFFAKFFGENIITSVPD